MALLVVLDPARLQDMCLHQQSWVYLPYPPPKERLAFRNTVEARTLSSQHMHVQHVQARSFFAAVEQLLEVPSSTVQTLHTCLGRWSVVSQCVVVHVGTVAQNRTSC